MATLPLRSVIMTVSCRADLYQSFSTRSEPSVFIIFMEGGFPINILNTIKNVPEVCRIFCATANPVEVIVAETEQGRGILGVIDGMKTKGIETEAEIKTRKEFLRKIGYKL